MREKCPKTEAKSKNPIKLAGIRRSDACNVRKFNLLGRCSLRIVFCASVLKGTTHNNRQRNYFSKNFISKPID